MPTAAEAATTQSLILTSYTIGMAANVAVDTTAGSITIPVHQRVYGDRTVAVAGGTISGLSTTGVSLIYYDDLARVGGAVAYQATSVAADAYVSADHPGRHFVFYYSFAAGTGGVGAPAGTGGGTVSSGGGTGTGGGRPGANIP